MANKKQIKEEESEDKKIILTRDVKKSIWAILLFIFALIFLLSLFKQAGIVGNYIDRFLGLFFGTGRYVLPIFMAIVGVIYFKRMDNIRYMLTTLGAIISLVFLIIILHSFYDIKEMKDFAGAGKGGGYLGMTLAYLLIKYLGKAAAFIIAGGGFLIGLILLFNFPLNRPYYWIRGILIRSKQEGLFSFNILKKGEGQEDEEIDEDEAKQSEERTEDNIKVDTIQFVEDPNDHYEDNDTIGFKEKTNNFEFDKKDSIDSVNKNFSDNGNNWHPPFDILQKSSAKAKPKNLQKQADVIKKTLHNFGIEVEISGYNVGPSVIQYTFKPAVGVKLSRIVALQNDLALSLAASSVRIEAPIPGRSLVGVEVPLYQSERSTVRMGTIMESETFKNKKSNLTLALGEDVHGDLILSDIERMPHLMIAGSTGTGKSVCINSILTALLYQNSPEKLKLILVDPKRVELSAYNNIPHLLTPVIVDTHKVVNALKWAISEMERRYKLLQDVGARDIQSYNQKANKGKKRQVLDKETKKYRYEDLERIPFIVIVIDELADLMAAHGREVEGAIQRLTQMARAVGIHLVVSTQRPSVDVITGIIKANIGTRVAFRVTSQVDSRTILDMPGAEKLLGNGDMLYKSNDSQKPRRIQGVFVSEQEVGKLVKWIKKQKERPVSSENEQLSDSLKESLDNTAAGGGTSGGGDFDDKDEAIYGEAKRLVIEMQKASTTFLQRKLSIGYPKAANIMDRLEEEGVVGSQEGSKARKVLASSENQEVDNETEV